MALNRTTGQVTAPTGPEGTSGAAQAVEASRSPADEESIGRNTAFALAIQVTTAAFTAALTIFLVRVLDPPTYGVFALALSVGSLLILPSDFGISQSAARFIAERRSRPADVQAVLATALRLKLVASGAFSAALFLSAAAIAAAYGEPALTWPLRGVALAVFGQSLMTLYHYSFIAVGRVSVGLRLVASKSVAEAGATVVLVLLGAGAVGAAGGRAVGFGFGAVFAVLLAARLFGGRSLSLRARGGIPARQIAGYAGALLIVDGAFAALSQVDVLLIGAILGTASVGLFEPIVRLVTFLHYPGLSVANGVAPRLARGEGRRPNVRAFEAGLRGLVILQAAVIAPVVVWADPVVALLLGPRYEESATVLRALAPFIFLSGIAPLVSVSVNYLGEARLRVPIALAALAVNIAIDLLLLRELGIVAGAIGTDVAYALYVPAHFVICKRMLGLNLRPLLLTLLRALLAAVAMGLVLTVIGTSSLSPLEWLVGGVSGLVAFACTLLLTREISFGEIREAKRFLAARLGRAPARG